MQFIIILIKTVEAIVPLNGSTPVFVIGLLLVFSVKVLDFMNQLMVFFEIMKAHTQCWSLEMKEMMLEGYIYREERLSDKELQILYHRINNMRLTKN